VVLGEQYHLGQRAVAPDVRRDEAEDVVVSVEKKERDEIIISSFFFWTDEVI
jgi:hypothetical protein